MEGIGKGCMPWGWDGGAPCKGYGGCGWGPRSGFEKGGDTYRGIPGKGGKYGTWDGKGSYDGMWGFYGYDMWGGGGKYGGRCDADMSMWNGKGYGMESMRGTKGGAMWGWKGNSKDMGKGQGKAAMWCGKGDKVDNVYR